MKVSDVQKTDLSIPKSSGKEASRMSSSAGVKGRDGGSYRHQERQAASGQCQVKDCYSINRISCAKGGPSHHLDLGQICHPVVKSLEFKAMRVTRVNKY